jgi:hypothetical protein
MGMNLDLSHWRNTTEGEGECVREEKKKGIYGHKEKQVSGGCRNFHNEALQNVYCSHYIIRQTKSRRLKMWGKFANMGMTKYLQTVVMGKRVERRDNLEGLGVYVMIQLIHIIERPLILIRQGPGQMAGLYECGNESRFALLHLCAPLSCVLHAGCKKKDTQRDKESNKVN